MIPISLESERIYETANTDWVPQEEEPFVFAQLVLDFHGIVTIAVYSGVEKYAESKSQNFSLNNRPVTHMIQIDPYYPRKRLFKRVGNEPIKEDTPFQVYSYPGKTERVAILPTGRIIIETPKLGINDSLMRTGMSCMGGVVEDLLRHIYIERISDGYDKTHEKYSVREDRRIVDFIQLPKEFDLAAHLQELYDNHDPDSPLTPHVPQAPTLTWEEGKRLLLHSS